MVWCRQPVVFGKNPFTFISSTRAPCREYPVFNRPCGRERPADFLTPRKVLGKHSLSSPDTIPSPRSHSQTRSSHPARPNQHRIGFGQDVFFYLYGHRHGRKLRENHDRYFVREGLD